MPKTTPNSFACFILTHGRPDRVHTFDTLRRCGYTGKIYIIIDNEDETADEYRAKYGDSVIMFDKASIAETFDEGDNFEDRRAIVYARNACFGIAETLGIEYFMELDDDYSIFCYRYNHRHTAIKEAWIKNLDAVFAIMVRYYKAAPIRCIAMAQSGDFQGGRVGYTARNKKALRKCMNTQICSTHRPFQFIGRVNEDVNAYTFLGGRGEIMLTVTNTSITQHQTQTNPGGMSEMYLHSGTYVKSFYTVMYSPSCTRIQMMGNVHKRLHHAVRWDHAVPCIIDERYKKAS